MLVLSVCFSYYSEKKVCKADVIVSLWPSETRAYMELMKHFR